MSGFPKHVTTAMNNFGVSFHSVPSLHFPENRYAS